MKNKEPDFLRSEAETEYRRGSSPLAPEKKLSEEKPKRGKLKWVAEHSDDSPTSSPTKASRRSVGASSDVLGPKSRSVNLEASAPHLNANGLDEPLTESKPEVDLPVVSRLAIAAKAVDQGTSMFAKQREKNMDRDRVKRTRAANLKGKNLPVDDLKVVRKLEAVWREEMLRLKPDWIHAEWGIKEREQALQLHEGFTYEQTERLIQYVIRRWSFIRASFAKNPPGSTPKLGWCIAFREEYVNDARVWFEYEELRLQLEQGEAAYEEPPPELKAKMAALKQAVKELPGFNR